MQQATTIPELWNKLVKRMRVDPSEKTLRRGETDEVANEKTEKTTRIVALVVAFISVFMLFIKILFL